MEHSEMMDERFTMPQRLKNISLGLLLLGLLGIIISFFIYTGEDGQKHLWAALVMTAVYFQGIAMTSAFFLAATYVAYGGWHTVLKRIPEAISMVLPVTAILLLLILLVPNFIYGHHPVYEWTNKEIVNHDPVMKGKTAYLNLPFFFTRFLFFVGILTFLAIKMRKNSLMEDHDNSIKYYKSNLTWASLFLVFFAVYILVTSWDWLMSIDTHWYSTMYGWYTFASNWVNGIAVITLVLIYLKSKGYMKQVTDSHMHDLGILMFAFSIFWTYVTFCQFMLIWYANIPEETEYFRMRYDHFMPFFYGIFILNFVSPFLILISRDAKRKRRVMVIAAIIILIGHYTDYYLMVMPATVGTPKFGLIEMSAILFYVGVMIYMLFTNFSKANTIPKHHPFLEESLHRST